MTTNEERKEVARKLREKYHEREAAGWVEVKDLGIQALNYLKDLESCLPDGDSFFTVLADLIEPEEGLAYVVAPNKGIRDMGTREGFLNAIRDCGRFIIDNAESILGRYPGAQISKLSLSVDFDFQSVPTLTVNREHLVVPRYKENEGSSSLVAKMASIADEMETMVDESCDGCDMLETCDHDWEVACVESKMIKSAEKIRRACGVVE